MQSKRLRIGIVIVGLVLLSVGIFVAVKNNKFKADSALTTLLVDNFDSGGGRAMASSVNSGSVVADSEALSGSSVLQLGSSSRGRTATLDAGAGCVSPLNDYAISSSLASRLYSFSYGIRGTLTGPVKMRISWKERSGRNTLTKNQEKVISPTDISATNWTIANQIFKTPDTFVNGSLVFQALIQCGSSVFSGSIDSVAVNVISQMDHTSNIGEDTTHTMTDYVQTTIPLNIQIDKPLQSIKIAGSGKINATDGGLNVVLEGADGSQSLIDQRYNFDQKGSFNFGNLPIETAVLDDLKPKNIVIYNSTDVVWSIDNIRVVLKESKLDATVQQSISSGRLIGLDNVGARKRAREVIRQSAANNLVTGLSAWAEKNSIPAKFDVKNNLSATYSATSRNAGSPYLSANIQMLSNYESGYLTMHPSSAPVIDHTRFPSTFNWANKDGVSPADASHNWITSPKDQRPCGSCFAFAAVGQMEAAINLRYNQHLDYDLSEQQAMCGSGGCGGGLTQNVLNKFQDTPLWGESLNPYLSSDNSKSCTINQPAQKSAANPSPVEELGWKNVTTGGAAIDVFSKNYFKSEQWYADAYMANLMKYGPFAVGLPEFKHAMLLVGWTEANGKLTWIFKNSWGQDMGVSGTDTSMKPIAETIVSQPVPAPSETCPSGQIVAIKLVDGQWQKTCRTSETVQTNITDNVISAPAPSKTPTCPPGYSFVGFVVDPAMGTVYDCANKLDLLNQTKLNHNYYSDPAIKYDFTCPANSGTFSSMTKDKDGWHKHCAKTVDKPVNVVEYHDEDISIANPAPAEYSCPTGQNFSSIILDNKIWTKNCIKPSTPGGYFFYQTGGVTYSYWVLGILKVSYHDTFPFHADKPTADVAPVSSLGLTDKFPTVTCSDNDNDGYYYWGLGAKPATCPKYSPAEEDANDSNQLLGPEISATNHNPKQLSNVSFQQSNGDLIIGHSYFTAAGLPVGILLSQVPNEYAQIDYSKTIWKISVTPHVDENSQSVPSVVASGSFVITPSTPNAASAVWDHASAKKTISMSTGQQIGDANNNGTVDIGDSVKVSRVVTGLDPIPQDICPYDANKNGSIDIGDATVIQRIVVGLVTSPGTCGKPASTTEYHFQVFDKTTNNLLDDTVFKIPAFPVGW